MEGRVVQPLRSVEIVNRCARWRVTGFVLGQQVFGGVQLLQVKRTHDGVVWCGVAW